RLAREVSAVLDAEEFPIVLGGDHSCAIATWRGAAKAVSARGLLGLVGIDAHMDGHTPPTSPSGMRPGMPLAALLAHGADAQLSRRPLFARARSQRIPPAAGSRGQGRSVRRRDSRYGARGAGCAGALAGGTRALVWRARLRFPPRSAGARARRRPMGRPWAALSRLDVRVFRGEPRPLPSASRRGALAPGSDSCRYFAGVLQHALAAVSRTPVPAHRTGSGAAHEHGSRSRRNRAQSS